MNTLKKNIVFLMILVLVLALAILHFTRKANEQRETARLQAIQASICDLEAERDSLEAKLDELHGTSSLSDDTVNKETTQATAVLCVANVTEAFYEQVFPAMKENGQTGIVILRNGRLPGDETDDIISVGSFVNMMEAGWSYAISIEDTSDDWQDEIENYTDSLIERVGIAPTVYCFDSEETEEYISFLEEEGFETILCHNKVNNNMLKVVQLLSYSDDELQIKMSKMNGYCGLEVWTAWQDDTDEALKYDEDKFQSLMSNNNIKVTGLDELELLSSGSNAEGETDSEFNADHYTSEEEIQQRLTEIQDEIDSLYR